MKKTLILALIAVFAFAVPALAVNRIEVKVTSEPIQYHALCDKAGGFSLEFDVASQLRDGDQVTIDMDFGVTLCRTVDLEISAGANGGEWNAGNVPAAGSPVIATAGVGTVNNGLFFRVHGLAGQQRVTVDFLSDADNVLGNDGLNVLGMVGLDKLVIMFLDQKTNVPDFPTQKGIWTDPNHDGKYDTAATLADNTLCINVSQWDGLTVEGHMDSKDDKYTFIPSNPEVAHVVPAQQFALVSCKAECGNLLIGARAVQSGADTCHAFDVEADLGAGANSGYCGTYTGNKLVLQNLTTAFDAVDYDIRLEILVNGMTGANGVYFSNQPVLTDANDNLLTGICVDTAASFTAGTQANYTYRDGTGATVAAANVAAPISAAANSCDVPGSYRAVYLETDASLLGFNGTTNDYLWINIPAMNYDLDEIQAGDRVDIRVTLIKAPCGEIGPFTFCAGTFGCVVVPPANTLLYPYYSNMDGSGGVGYWDGFVVTNLGTAAGTATVYAFEADGDQGSATVPVDAQSLYADLLSNVVGTMTQTAGSGTLGDSNCYIVVCTDFNCDGFAFMGEYTYGTAMGYLPRITSGLCP